MQTRLCNCALIIAVALTFSGCSNAAKLVSSTAGGSTGASGELKVGTNTQVFNLDAAAANAAQGPYTGTFAANCSGSSTWYDLNKLLNGTLSSFTDCGNSDGWVGSGTSTNPYALLFTGAERVTASMTGLPSGTTSKSFSMWIKTDQAWSNDAAIYEGGTEVENENIVLGISNSGYSLNTGSSPYISQWGDLVYADVTGYGNGDPEGNTVNSVVSDGNWHYLVYVYDHEASDLYSIYLDGQTLVASGTMTTNTQLSSKMTLGGCATSACGGTSYVGYLATFGIYNYAMSPADAVAACELNVARFSGASCH